MKKFSKFIAVSLASSMMLSTVALAAEDDFYNESDLKTPKYALDQVSLNEKGIQDEISLKYTDYFREVDKYLYTIEQTKEAYAKANKAGEPLKWKEYLNKEEGIPLEDEEVADDLKEIKSVEGIKKGVYDIKDQLGFKVNGKERTVRELKKAGYTVKFRADDKIFDTAEKISSGTGKILVKKTALEDEGNTALNFAFEVDILKDGKVVKTSERVEDEKIMDFNSQVEEITEVKLVQGKHDFKDNKIPVHEKKIKLDVEGRLKTGDIVNVTHLIKKTSADKELVLEIVNNDTIKGLAIGDANLTFEISDKVSKTLNVVVGDKAVLADVTGFPSQLDLVVDSMVYKDLEFRDSYGRVVPASNFAEDSAEGSIETSENLDEIFELMYDASKFAFVAAETVPGGEDEKNVEGKITFVHNDLGSLAKDIKVKLVEDVKIDKENYDLVLYEEDGRDSLDIKHLDYRSSYAVDLKLIGVDTNGIEHDYNSTTQALKDTFELALVEDKNETEQGKTSIYINKGKDLVDTNIESGKLTVSLKENSKAKPGDIIELEALQKTGDLIDVVGKFEIKVVDTTTIVEEAVIKDFEINDKSTKKKVEDILGLKTNPKVKYTYELGKDENPDFGPYPIIEVYEEGKGEEKYLLGELRIRKAKKDLIANVPFNKSEGALRINLKKPAEDAVDKNIVGEIEFAFVDRDNKEMTSKRISVDALYED